MPFNRKLYPSNWKELSLQCKERAGWKCEQCGIAEGTSRQSLAKRWYGVRLTAAHLDHDPENAHARLAALCEVCHLRYDGAMHGLHRHQTVQKRKHQKYIEAGQLELFQKAE